MTDLERAQWAIRGEPETWVNMIVMHLAAARREGAEAERRAALRAVLPAEPTCEMVEAMARAMVKGSGQRMFEDFDDANALDDRRWWYWRAQDAYRALRAHLLGGEP